MTAPNHVLGGLVITGLFGSFLNLNILSNPLYIGATIFGALIPDIDYTKSLIGSIFRPISKYLNQRFGHRTITHSLAALFVSSLLSGIIENTFLHQTTISKIYFLGFFSHLVLDMMTVQGVPLFYPFLRNPCVLPGNPNARFTTGNFQSETLIFCFFLLSFVFLQPLFENGFWTQYNRYFGTPKHLASEFHKSDSALKVKYKIKKGTELLTGEGICLSANESNIVLLEEEGFHHIQKDRYTIVEVLPEHTDLELHFKTLNFYNISSDSLNQLLQEKPVKELNAFANFEFEYIWNGISRKGQQLVITYPENLLINAIPDTIRMDRKLFFSNPKIKTVKTQIAQQLELQQKKQLAIARHQNQLKQLRILFDKSRNLLNRQELYNQIKVLEKIKLPKPDFSKLESLKTQLTELQRRDIIAYKKQYLNRGNLLKQYDATRFSGLITQIHLRPN